MLPHTSTLIPRATAAHRLARWALVCIAFTISLSGCNFMQPRKKVGRLAPKLTIDRWFQAPPQASASWLSQRGKVVVLNFFEPWDDGSMNEMDRLNRLQAAYAASDAVRFIHVTSERSSATLTRATDLRPITGWIAQDWDRTVFTAYGVHEYPDTWLINGEGQVIAITKPRFVTREVIDAILAGRTEVPIDDGYIN